MLSSAPSLNLPFGNLHGGHHHHHPHHHHNPYAFNHGGLPSSLFHSPAPLAHSGATNFQLPRTLERPPFNEVTRMHIAALAPELADVPIEYTRKRLRAQAPQLIAGLRALSSSHIPASLSKSQLSRTRTLTVPLRSSSVPANTLPTHILALSPSKPASSTSTSAFSASGDALLFPVHALALALHCAALPRLPSCSPPKVSKTAAAAAQAHTVTLPVVSLSVPSPASFPALQNFLYTHDSAALLVALLGSPSALPASFLSQLGGASRGGRSGHSSSGNSATATTQSTLASGQKLHQLSAHLAEALGRDLQTMMGRATAIVGCWRNVVALGVADPDVWDVLDLAYEVLLGAMNIVAAHRS